MYQRIAMSAALCLGLTAVAFAGDDDKVLTIGDKAPAIEVSHWLKGDEVTTFEKDKIYVVEFWATWCGPCLAGMPHLSELQEEYRDYDVTILGISDEKLSIVVDFLTKEQKEGQLWNSVIGYTLAADPDRSVFNDYMKAAGQRGIPTAFVVGRTGQIEWIGHPTNLDPVIEALVHDEWDTAASKATFEKKQAAARRMMEMQTTIRKAQKEGNWEAIADVYDSMLADDPENMGLLLQKFNALVTLTDNEVVYQTGEKLVKLAWGESSYLNAIAWTVADNPDIKHRDLDFALKVATRACELTKYEDGMILDTLARVYYEKGDLNAAIKWQKKAVQLTDGQKGIADALTKYEKEAAGG